MKVEPDQLFSKKITGFKRRRLDHRINLKSNELCHPLADEIITSIATSLCESRLRQYPVYQDVVDDFAAYFSCKTEEMLLTPGSDLAIRLLCNHYINETGQEGILVLQSPNYEAWEEVAGSRGLKIQRVFSEHYDCHEQGTKLLTILNKQPGLLVAISIPNGLTGACMPSKILNDLVDAAERNNHLLVIDACYQAFNGRLTQYVGTRNKHVMVVQSLSKSHALAGARLAVLYGSPERLLSLSAGPLEHAVAAPSLLAGRLAIGYHEKFAEIWSDIKEVRENTKKVLQSYGLDPLPSGGNFITVRMNDFNATKITALLADSGYIIRDLSQIHTLKNALRFTVADSATMNSYLKVLKNSLCLSRETMP